MHTFPNRKYKIVYADPLWYESAGEKTKRGVDRHYPLLKTKEIMKLPVTEMADEGCLLYFWVTNNFMKDGIKVMESWGFRYVTMITWMKEGNPGLGQYFRGLTEHCLFGVKGKLPYKVKEDGKRGQGKTGFIAPRGKHSEKPEILREWIQMVSHEPYIYSQENQLKNGMFGEMKLMTHELENTIYFSILDEIYRIKINCRQDTKPKPLAYFTTR